MASAASWAFLAEGAAHVVFRHNDPKVPIVLRLRKLSGPSAVRCARHSGALRPLLGEEYLPMCTVVRVSRSFVEELQARCRAASDGAVARMLNLDIAAEYGWVEADCSRFPSARWPVHHAPLRTEPLLCFELKPKAAVLQPGSLARGLPRYCRACALHVAKAVMGSAAPEEKSDYCPLDLFSGNRHRMWKALRALIRAPRNNLLLWVDGDPLYGHGRTDIEPVLARVGKTAALEDESDEHPLLRHPVLREYLRALTDVLVQEPILARLYAVQAEAEVHSVAHVREAAIRTAGGEEARWETECPLCTAALPCRGVPGREEKLSKVHAWLVALTSRDCSLLIPMQKRAGPGAPSTRTLRRAGGRRLGVVTTHEGAVFEYAIGAVDLDLKPAWKILRHVDQDRKVHEALCSPLAPQVRPPCW